MWGRREKCKQEGRNQKCVHEREPAWMEGRGTDTDGGKRERRDRKMWNVCVCVWGGEVR